jgi:beta-lactamase superfamily II metal-dependent hydrolase
MDNPSIALSQIGRRFESCSAHKEKPGVFMGDADVAVESSILSSGSPVKADILKVVHHGSKYSSSVAFLKAVSPAVAVYSAGLGKSHGHPAPQTIANLQNVGARILGTDKDGTITLRIDATGERNADYSIIDRQFRTTDARIKLKQLYPTISQ